jgi:hypothetical protein
MVSRTDGVVMTPNLVPISLLVDPASARTFEAMTGQQRLKAETLLRIRLREVLEVLTKPQRPFAEILDEIGERAAANGLTEAELESILNEPRVPSGG